EVAAALRIRYSHPRKLPILRLRAEQNASCGPPVRSYASTIALHSLRLLRVCMPVIVAHAHSVDYTGRGSEHRTDTNGRSASALTSSARARRTLSRKGTQ